MENNKVSSVIFIHFKLIRILTQIDWQSLVRILKFSYLTYWCRMWSANWRPLSAAPIFLPAHMVEAGEFSAQGKLMWWVSMRIVIKIFNSRSFSGLDILTITVPNHMVDTLCHTNILTYWTLWKFCSCREKKIYMKKYSFCIKKSEKRT